VFESCAHGDKSGRCVDCLKAYGMRWRANNPGRTVSSNRLRQYGVSPEQYEAMLHAQDFRCKLCRVPDVACTKSLAIDHDHATGEIRGLLCSSCNSGIGKLGDNLEGLERAVAYLKGEV
jgi:recombination endonuclease VII